MTELMAIRDRRGKGEQVAENYAWLPAAVDKPTNPPQPAAADPQTIRASQASQSFANASETL